MIFSGKSFINIADFALIAKNFVQSNLMLSFLEEIQSALRHISLNLQAFPTKYFSSPQSFLVNIFPIILFLLSPFTSQVCFVLYTTQFSECCYNYFEYIEYILLLGCECLKCFVSPHYMKHIYLELLNIIDLYTYNYL